MCPAIEKVWSVAKCHFNKRMLSVREELDANAFHNLVLESLTQIPAATIARLTYSNRAYIASLLQELAAE